MKSTKTVGEVMTQCPHSVGLDQPSSIAEKLMKQYNIRHLPVQSGGRLVGVISERDVKYATAWGHTTDGELMVDEIYMPEPYMVQPDTPLETVLETLIHDRIGCALVVKHESLTGIFTTTDACRLLAQALKGDLKL